MMDGGVGYPLFDLTSSGLIVGGRNRWRAFWTHQHRVAAMNWGNNFGVILIDWERADPLIRLQIRDEDGDIVIQRKIPHSLLQPGTLPVDGP